MMKKASQLPRYEGLSGNLDIVGVNKENGETVIANLATVIRTLAGMEDPRMKPFVADNLRVGSMLFYDRAQRQYLVVWPEAVAAVLNDYNETRYETNHDTYVGTFDGVAHFTAIDDAAMLTSEQGGNDVAATNCYYRIEIDNTAAGSITFSAASGKGSIASTTISWNAGDTMASIVSKFTAKNASSNYIVFAALADGKGVGLNIGGYGANTLTVTASTGCTVIDCSGLALLLSKNPAVKMGDTFNPSAAYTFLGKGTHHNFRGATARSILSGAYPDMVTASTVCIAVDGYNYSYRTLCNFAKAKEWASVNGESTFFDDGEDEQSGGQHVADPGAHVMNEATFNSGIRDYAGSDVQHLGMKDYYTHLLTDQTGEYAERRQELESKYGQMTSMYDAYLMSHMIDPAANSGIVAMMRNRGLYQTKAKADLMNVTYDYLIIPAYPPEYNAQHYGIATSEGFAPSTYYHPEPGDIGLMFRDDIMPVINANVEAAGKGNKLTNSQYRGSSADYGKYSWSFCGTSGTLNAYSRYFSNFRCRPALALPISN